MQRAPRYFLSLVVAITVLGLSASVSIAGRIAWVVGNGAYASLAPVKHAIDDARAVADALSLTGFEVRAHYDCDAATLAAIWSDIRAGVAEGKCRDCVFYFSGHAKAHGDQQYFLPVDAARERDLASLVTFEQLILALNGHTLSDGASILLLDVERAPSRTRGASFLRFDFDSDSVNKTALMFSYRADALSGEGGGGLSPFARAVVTELRKPGLELADFYRSVRSGILRATDGRTWPRLVGTLPRPFYFHPRAGAPDSQAGLDFKTRAARVLVEQEDGRLVPTYSSSHALLIGASDYRNEAAWYDLEGVDLDIARVAAVLADRHGFEVKTLMNPTRAGIEKALADFAVGPGQEENARLVIYFAGHGHTMGVAPLRTGWLVPVDAPDPGKDPSGFLQKAVSMDEIRKYSLIMRAKHVLWVFDSCFSGQIIEKLRGGQPDNWETFLQTGRVRRVITSGAANQRVPDTSVFASYFVAALDGRLKAGSDDGLVTGNQFSHFLKGRVIQDRGELQTPQFGTIKLFGAEEGDIIFKVQSAPAATTKN